MEYIKCYNIYFSFRIAGVFPHLWKLLALTEQCLICMSVFCRYFNATVYQIQFLELKSIGNSERKILPK